MVRKSSKTVPEKVRIELKSQEFHHYSSLDPVVRNAKFCVGPTVYLHLRCSCLCCRFPFWSPLDLGTVRSSPPHLYQQISRKILRSKFISMHDLSKNIHCHNLWSGGYIIYFPTVKFELLFQLHLCSVIKTIYQSLLIHARIFPFKKL